MTWMLVKRQLIAMVQGTRASVMPLTRFEHTTDMEMTADRLFNVVGLFSQIENPLQLGAGYAQYRTGAEIRIRYSTGASRTEIKDLMLSDYEALSVAFQDPAKWSRDTSTIRTVQLEKENFLVGEIGIEESFHELKIKLSIIHHTAVSNLISAEATYLIK